ncbi:DoxX family protein [Plantactinospora siamensis]|uniref:DoxX family protein n=1 Tax=Plantactinospora siamensis TaxID=555372 RepID=A0ABV6P2G8_9ACTN
MAGFTDLGRSPDAAGTPPRPAETAFRHPVGYWVTTGIIGAECAVGGLMDLLRLPPFYPVMIQLGYPGYLATIMGTAKIIAAAVLLAPRLPRLKEWAYAGVMINMIGAAASHLAAHQPTGPLAPATFAVLALLSWAWRPPGRRLAG